MTYKFHIQLVNSSFWGGSYGVAGGRFEGKVVVAGSESASRVMERCDVGGDELIGACWSDVGWIAGEEWFAAGGKAAGKSGEGLKKRST